LGKGIPAAVEWKIDSFFGFSDVFETLFLTGCYFLLR